MEKEHLKADNAELKHKLEKMSVETQKANSCIEIYLLEIKELQSVNKDLNINCHYLQSLINDDKEIEIYDDTNNSFIPAYRETVMKLTSLNVATANVNEVINTSLKLSGKMLSRLPSRKTINNNLLL